MKFALLIAVAAFVCAPASYARYNRAERDCFARIMERAINDRWVVVARSAEERCACIANMVKQGLSANACPSWKGVRESDYYEFFVH